MLTHSCRGLSSANKQIHLLRAQSLASLLCQETYFPAKRGQTAADHGEGREGGRRSGRVEHRWDDLDTEREGWSLKPLEFDDRMMRETT